MLVFADNTQPHFEAETDVHAILLGGAPVGKRHIWWNFVSSSKERIEQAKRDWREGMFGKIPGDDVEVGQHHRICRLVGVAAQHRHLPVRPGLAG